MRAASISFVLVLLLACSGEDPTGPPPGTPFPEVDLTLGFGDAPVTGAIQIEPSAASTEWRYTVDLDRDGVPEVEGTTATHADVPFEYQAVGVHRLTVRLQAGDRDTTLERAVVVNDPSLTTLLQQTLIPPPPGAQPYLEGIVTGQVEGREVLYIGQSTAPAVLSLDPQTLEVVAEQTLGPDTLPAFNGVFPVLEGFALEPDGSALYVLERNSVLIVLEGDISSLEKVLDLVEHRISPRFFITRVGDGIVLAGGNGILPGLILLDVRSGEVLRERAIHGADHFAVSPDMTRVVINEVSVDGAAPAVSLLSFPDFADVWRRPLPATLQPRVVSFTPDGERIYVMGPVNQLLRLFVLDAATGEILRDQPIEPCSSCLRRIVANPVATSADGRYVLFPAAGRRESAGIYLIDTTLDLVVHRAATEPSTGGCCNIAAALDRNEFYAVDLSGGVFRFRING